MNSFVWRKNNVWFSRYLNYCVFDKFTVPKIFDLTSTVWKVSKYGVFSGPYFPVLGPEKTAYLDTFLAVVIIEITANLKLHFQLLLKILGRTTGKIYQQCQEIKQNWAGRENFDICFCVIFDHLYQSFISGRKTEY